MTPSSMPRHRAASCQRHPTASSSVSTTPFSSWTGYTRDELVRSRRFVDLLTVGGRLYHETHFMPLLQMQSTARELAFEIVCADGTRMPVLVNGVLKRDENGARVGRAYGGLPGNRPPRIRARAAEGEATRRGIRGSRPGDGKDVAVDAASTGVSRRSPGLDVGAVYRPAGSGEEVGGDFYDVFQIAVDDWVVVIGDVCGKGVDAAVVTALARYTCRAASVEHDDPARVLIVVNEVLLNHESRRHCSAAVARVRRVDHVLVSLDFAGRPSARTAASEST